MAAARVFSARIVCIDYYMSPPIPGVDVLYSSFQGGKVNEVPVIRVYGPTPAGQKTCLHVHKAFPYLYVPISDVKLDAQREGEACANSIALGLEKALKLKGNAGSKRQHIHGHNLVRAKKFYGYHQLEELFVKIYLYYPQDVSRATNLLLGGAVLNKTLQPHESHIPFILQFMIDYNLYGMGHVHLSKMRFRHPVPSMFTGKKFSCNQQQLMCMDPSSWCSANVQADTSAGENFDSPVWVSSAIPDDWTWHVFSKPGVSLAPEFQHVKRQSACELEGDTTIDEIINQQFKSYTSLSQTVSDVKMVQSLIPIWEEEHQRTGIHDTTIPPDPGKPLPKDVLKTFLNSLEFEFKLQELSCRTDAGPLLSDDITRYFLSGSSFSDKKGFADPDNLNCTDTYGRTTVGISDQQIVDTEALGLLRWLATSQAAEDINSDDELVRETILSPLLPASTMDKVLEKANIDFESESQKECQDILDSVKDVSEVDHLKEKSTVVCETTPKNQPPLGNDCNLCLSSAGSFSKVDIECETLEQPILLSSSVSHANKSKGKRPLWGSLPLNMKVDDSDDGSSPSGKTEFSLVEGFVGKAMASNEGLGCSTGAGVSESRMVSCSVRDLMRKKRQRRVSEQDNVLVCDRKFVSGAQEQGSHLLSKRLDFHTVGGDDHLEKPVALETFTSNDEDSPSYLSVPESDEQNISINLSEKQHVIVSDCMPSSFSNLEKVLAKSCGQVSGPLYRNPEAGLLTGHDEDSSCMKKPLHSTFPQNKNVHASSRTEELTSPCSPLHKMNDRDPQASLGHFEEKEGVKQNTMQLDYETQQKGLMDLSAHYQNDGSLLYLLTPSLSPPSADCVNEWLLHGCQDTSREVNAAFSEALVIRGSSKFEAHSSCVDHNDAVVLSSSISDCTPILDEVQQVNDHKSYENFRTCNDEETSAQSPENVVKKVATDCSVDVSQISGPDGGSRSTPLSQIGFRDPASVGAGQQLTLLSVEVLAETRADLRPNPRFDAINIISLVFQSDIDSAVEAYVLLRSNASSYHKNLDGVSGYKVLVQSEERSLFDELVKIINLFDPDIIMGWDVQGGSLGFLAERAAHLGIGLLNGISRTPTEMNKDSEEPKAVDSGIPETGLRESLVSSSPVIGGAVIQDEWGRTHASGVHVGGRVILNIWRLMRSEVRLTMYNIEDVCGTVLRRKIPSIPSKVLSRWFSNGAARYRCIEYLTERAKLNLAIMNQLDMVNRTSELARVFGIEFFSVLSRGSQYRVESMLLRLAHTQNYLAISPGNHQVASQPAMECVPLVMEPESGFYADPVVVLDFQSLYPSMIIAYNLCFSTCLGNIVPAKSNILGVSPYSADPHVLRVVKDDILLTPNGVMYVPSKTRIGVLPRLLDEILSTRIMVKKSMKKLAAPSEQVLHRIQNARQLALKLIANVTYGYTAAGFSGRMPCAELADSIVQCGRCTLERAISLVNANDNWKAKVVYGDTDRKLNSEGNETNLLPFTWFPYNRALWRVLDDGMFVLLKGRSLQEAFQIGRQIASAVTAMNPDPVTLKLEKVYHPCFLLTKKRYAGYSYESPEQVEPLFDAKGIETVRRDTCGVVAKMMEKSLRLFFEHQDILEVKTYFERQWKRILSGRVSLQDFVFAKEVRLGTYSTRVSSSLPPAAIVASKAMRVDPRAEPRYAERVPYVVIHGEPGARLVDMVVDPLDILTIDSPYRLNDLYYITKQIIPALQRVFGLLGADLNQWFLEMPRPARETSLKRPISAANPNKTRIDYYYLSKHCMLCGELVHATTRICHECLQNEASAGTALIGRTSKLEKEIQHLAAICRHCGGGDWLVESGVKCTSLACSVFYERRKVQKELRGISAIAAERGLYPKCMVEWF